MDERDPDRYRDAIANGDRMAPYYRGRRKLRDNALVDTGRVCGLCGGTGLLHSRQSFYTPCPECTAEKSQ